MVKIGNIALGDFPLLLAPMEDVSDPPFRVLCKRQGADMLYTEFISTEGLIRHAEKSVQKLDFLEEERPLGIQIFGADIDVMTGCAGIIEAAGPDLLDINFGCPVKKVVCKDAGAGILKDVPRMVRLTASIVKATHLPVTVKTRLGWDEHSKNIVEVAERLQDVGVRAITIHGRTRSQMYKGQADWSLIAAVKENPRMHIPVFGNGDVDTPQAALEKKNRYGVDGIMIGRAAIGYPWIFREIRSFLESGLIPPPPGMQERMDVCMEHLQRSLSWKGPVLGLLEMRRHYANYFRGIPNIRSWRNQLVTADTPEEIVNIFGEMLDSMEAGELVERA